LAGSFQYRWDTTNRWWIGHWRAWRPRDASISERQWSQTTHPQGSNSTQYNLFILDTSAPHFKQNLITVVSAMIALVYSTMEKVVGTVLRVTGTKETWIMNTARSCRVFCRVVAVRKTCLQIADRRNGRTFSGRKTNVPQGHSAKFRVLEF
jgi:hypothetical protein